MRAAQVIYAAARAHKRSELHHRRQAKSLMREFDQIRRECDRAGIHIEITQTPLKEESQ